MTPGNNGASTPEDDDPFGYLYADGQASGATPPRTGGYGYPGPAAPQQPGVPRTSYNQVRTVGERQYGQVPQQPYGQPQQPYGQPPQQYGQQPYGQPTAQYAAPETYPGGAPSRPAPPADGGRGGRGPNTKGLLIGAVAVVAAVVIGIGVALLSNSDGDKKDDTAKPPAGGGSAGTSQQPSTPPTNSASTPADLPKQDAATLKLTGGAALGKDVPGAVGAGGNYVTLNTAGAAATWTFDVPQSGAYTMFINYGVPGKDAKTTLVVNGNPPTKINMANFAKAQPGAWDKGWTHTFSWINLNKGSNTIKISCEQGDQCETNLDQVSLKAGQVRN
ncbi:CBM35 domain-containing protein [Streptomyces sp. NPDC059070]|uniref:CBM35 domain-containing protein n=1 Tax=Streptomyces sp. NPDC059070 TaxID=3346713 RepID=UPI00369387FE